MAMDKWLDRLNKTWLITLVLLIGLGSVSYSSLSHSVNQPRQTEVAIRPSSLKATPVFISTFSKKVPYYAGDLCSSTRINTHTQHVVLRLKNSEWKVVSKSSALGHSHHKKLNTKEDTDLPRS